jgi:hypothetical protein
MGLALSRTELTRRGVLVTRHSCHSKLECDDLTICQTIL